VGGFTGCSGLLGWIGDLGNFGWGGWGKVFQVLWDLRGWGLMGCCLHVLLFGLFVVLDLFVGLVRGVLFGGWVLVGFGCVGVFCFGFWVVLYGCLGVYYLVG